MSPAPKAVVPGNEPGPPGAGAESDGDTAQQAAFSPFSGIGLVMSPPPAPGPAPAGDWSPSVIAVLAGAICIARLFRLLLR